MPVTCFVHLFDWNYYYCYPKDWVCMTFCGHGTNVPNVVHSAYTDLQ